MKRFSLKLKLTAMYSFFMVLVTCHLSCHSFFIEWKRNFDLCADAPERACP